MQGDLLAEIDPKPPRHWESPWRREPTPEEWAETARMLLDWVKTKPHCPDPERAVADLFAAFTDGRAEEVLHDALPPHRTRQ